MEHGFIRFGNADFGFKKWMMSNFNFYFFGIGEAKIFLV